MDSEEIVHAEVFVEGEPVNVIVKVAARGPQGPNSITANTATDLAGFLVGEDGNVRGISPWSHMVLESATNGVSVAITGGTYLTYNYQGAAVYRFISTTSDANGYPTEDAFYTTLSGGVLSGKIGQRNL